MRKLLFFALAVVIGCLASVTITGCDGRGSVADSLELDSLLAAYAPKDSLVGIVDEPVPDAADEFFDDFIFNFAENRRLQFERIVFPLVVTHGDLADTLTQREWEMEHFFMEQDYYTLIFDSEEHKELGKDTTLTRATVQKIYLESGYVTNYIFERLEGKWRMTAVNTQPYAEQPNASFLAFYSQFATDSLFQQSALNHPKQISGPDPDADFAVTEGFLMPEQWEQFAPFLPSGMIYNIVYGEPRHGMQQKIFVIRGIANGLETELTFRKRSSGRWVLVALLV